MDPSNRITIDPKIGCLTFQGRLEIMAGEHARLPCRPKPFPEAEQPFREGFFRATAPKSNSNPATRPSPNFEFSEAAESVPYAFLGFEKEESHNA